MGNLQARGHLEHLGIRWGDNIKVDIKETEWAGMDWCNVVQGSDKSQAVVSMVMNLWIL
jgi:hypothetical protein